MKKMLLIEDDTLTLTTLDRIFNKDFDVAKCESAEEFYLKYAESEFDIIITDISLRGGKNGLALTRELKEMPNYSSKPIICLTAHALSRDKENALSAGVDIFLTKPIPNKVLKEAVIFLLIKYSKS